MNRVGRFPQGLWFTTVAAVSFFAAPVFGQAVTVHSDLAYKSGPNLSEYEQERCALDLYLPEGETGFPVIVWFHGGNLTAGDKAGEIHVQVAQTLAERGIAVASVNYRLSPIATYPAYVEDAAASVAWVLDHIGDYGGDADSVFVSGHSAGAYLAFMVGLDQSYLAANGHSTSDLAGLIPISGQTITHGTVRTERELPDNRPLIDAAAPAFHVRNDAPPTLAIAGSDDIPARPQENAYLIAALRAAGHADATYMEFAGRNHGTIVTEIPEKRDEVAEAIVDFVGRISGMSH